MNYDHEELRRKLQVIRDNLEPLWEARDYVYDHRYCPDSPSFGQCDATACLLLELFGGHVRGGRSKMDQAAGFRSQLHYWNELPDGTIIDLTADQFDATIPGVWILPVGAPERHWYVHNKTDSEIDVIISANHRLVGDWLSELAMTLSGVDDYGALDQTVETVREFNFLK